MWSSAEWVMLHISIYTLLGVPQKVERMVFITFKFQNIAYFDFIRKNIVFWKEWYQDRMIWFGSIDSTIIFWNTVIYEFC